jgi:hypothetical protein
MAVRVTYVAIAVGGACGAFAALAGSPSASEPEAAPLQAPMAALPMRPVAQLPRPPVPSPPAVVATEARRLPATTSATATASAAPALSAALNVAAAAPPASSGDTTPPPTTKRALLRAEMRCDQKNVAACILAARGYETGSAGPSDSEKAAKYRKIALTLWITQCDRNSASACATLSDMYRAGRGVPQSDRNADALLARTRELCHYNDAPACHELPAP